MKKLLLLISFVSYIILCNGCAKVIQTHQQAIQSYHTKADVSKAFGPPDDKRIGAGLEEWTYSYDPQPSGITGKRDTSNTITDTVAVEQPVHYFNYVKFIFDPNGNVVGYKSHGVDFTKKKPSTGLKILKVVGLTAAIILLIGISYYSDSDITF